MDYPCHKREKSKWCDHSGSGGFMGHTCLGDIEWDFTVVPKNEFIHGSVKAADLGKAIEKVRWNFPENNFELVMVKKNH